MHCGHLEAARQLRRRARLGEVWLMPNAVPPHREEPGASPQDRLAMVRLAVAGEPGLEACDLEVERGGRSYTAETMDELGRRYPDRSFVLLLGYDAALGIGGWRDARRLLSSTPIVVFNRSGTTPPSSARLGRLGFDLERTRLIEIDSPSIAAHELRDRLRRRQPVDGLVPEAVADYIREHRLYREGVG